MFDSPAVVRGGLDGPAQTSSRYLSVIHSKHFPVGSCRYRERGVANPSGATPRTLIGACIYRLQADLDTAVQMPSVNRGIHERSIIDVLFFLSVVIEVLGPDVNDVIVQDLLA